MITGGSRAALEEAGYLKTVSKDLKSTNYTKGNNKYSLRDNANSHDGPTADFSQGGKTTLKIRLKKDGE